jgi:signal transduction histidine kinase
MVGRPPGTPFQQEHARLAAQDEPDDQVARQFDYFKREVLASLSHELRTPLTAVYGYAQMLERRAATADPAWVVQTATRIHAASAELRRLIEQVVDFWQVDQGTVAHHPQPFDLAPLLHELLAAWVRQPGGEHLVDEVAASLPVYADPQAVRQAITHLVDNARKYAPESTIVLRGQRAAGCVRVEVEDRGPGIPVEEQQRIWETLYRGRAVAELNIARGSGLGLALVKALVEAQGGQVGLESRPGWGACFWLALPVAAPGH